MSGVTELTTEPTKFGEVNARILAFRTKVGILCEWRGPVDGIVAFTKQLLEDAPGLFQVFPWRMKCVGQEGECLYFKRAEC
jgi:hypothetical protein